MSTLFVAFEDFILSREAQLCSPATIDFYRRMLTPFLALADGSPLSNRYSWLGNGIRLVDYVCCPWPSGQPRISKTTIRGLPVKAGTGESRRRLLARVPLSKAMENFPPSPQILSRLL